MIKSSLILEHLVKLQIKFFIIDWLLCRTFGNKNKRAGNLNRSAPKGQTGFNRRGQPIKTKGQKYIAGCYWYDLRYRPVTTSNKKTPEFGPGVV